MILSDCCIYVNPGGLEGFCSDGNRRRRSLVLLPSMGMENWRFFLFAVLFKSGIWPVNRWFFPFFFPPHLSIRNWKLKQLVFQTEQLLILCHVRQPMDVHRTKGRWWAAELPERRPNISNQCTLTMTLWYLFSIFWPLGVSSHLFSPFFFLTSGTPENSWRSSPFSHRLGVFTQVFLEISASMLWSWLWILRALLGFIDFHQQCCTSVIYSRSSLRSDPGLYWRTFQQWQKEFFFFLLSTRNIFLLM